MAIGWPFFVNELQPEILNMESFDIDKNLLDQPLTNLNIGLDVLNPLHRAGIFNISQVISLGYYATGKIYNLGEIRLESLFSTLATHLGVPIELLREHKATQLTQEQNQIFNINYELAQLPVSKLGITSPRIKRALKSANITTIEDLIASFRNDFKNVRGIGNNTKAIILTHLEIILSDPNPLEISRIEEVKKPLFNVESNSRPNLVTSIYLLSEVITQKLNNERGFRYIKYYYGLQSKNRYTLQDIGSAEGITRERVRQINAITLNQIRTALFGERHFLDVFIPGPVIEETKELHLSFKTEKGILSWQKIISILENRYEYVITENDHNLVKFLLTLFEFYEIPQAINGYNGSKIDAWRTDDEIHLPHLYTALTAVYRTLQKSNIPLSLFEIKIQANNKRKKPIEGEYIELATQICPDVELLENNLYQIVFSRLTSLANQAFRILFDKQKPLHFREILREINYHLAILGEHSVDGINNLTNQMASDSRFKPIGKSGKWALSTWDVVTQTTVAIMVEFFHRKQASSTVNEIHDYVITKRPNIPKESIVAYLYEKDEFVRVSANGYELAIWGSKAYKSKQRNSVQQELKETTIKFFSTRKEQEILQADLRKFLHSETGISESTITAWLYRTPLIKLKALPTKKKNNLAIYMGSESLSIQQERHSTLIEAVHFEVINFLEAQPDYRARVSDTAIFVIKKTACKKHTFYNYLDRIESVSKIKEDNVLYCFLNDRKKPVKESELQFPQIASIKNQKLKAEIQRATNLLNEQTVDIGLFQLGKVFENELKKLLVKAKEVNAFSVTRNDLSRLVNMIDCVTREMIVPEKHRLDFLRQERNERAHGQLPEISERQKLLKEAQFLAGSYIDYIILFHDKYLMFSNS